MPKPSAIDEFIDLANVAYRNVYDKFHLSAVRESANPVPKLAGSCFKVSQSPAPHVNSVEVHGALLVNRLPYKRKQSSSGGAATASEGIHVILDSLDIYKFNGAPSLKNSFLYKSNVHLGYYVRQKTKWRPLLYVRYDFASAKDAHPLFHAQICEGALEGPSAQEFGEIPEIVDLLKVHKSIRLPSANVIGATALVSLAADHLPINSFHEILHVVQKQPFFKDWRCDCTSLDVADSVTKMISSGWYGSN